MCVFLLVPDVMGSIPGRVKPKMLKCVSACLSIKQAVLRSKNIDCMLRVRIMCMGRVTCLITDCYLVN